MNSEQLENWADKLLIEYEDGRKELNRMKSELGDTDLDKQDKSQINSMVNDMTFAMEWMKTGRRPGNLRGIDKRSAYQRRVLLDMDLMPSLDIEPEERTLNQDEKQAIMDILIELSHRERQCYLLHMAQGWSFSEIQKEIGISRSTVQKYIERAKEKIEKNLCRASVVQTRSEDEGALV